MHYLGFLGTAAVLFFAMPWINIAFNKYCVAINRFFARRKKG